MSNSPSVTLTVRPRDPGDAYQITVLDASFNTVASGNGELAVKLPPGIYKVQASISRQSWETLVMLEPGRRGVTVEVPILSINSPVPLHDTAQHHEYHEDAAFQHSRNVHVTAGQGSAIFVLARRYTPHGEKQKGPVVHPLNEVALHDASGRRIVDLRAAAKSDLRKGIDAWAACNVAVSPGYYRLRMTLPSGYEVEQPLYAVAGWQLQIFALMAPFGPNPTDLRANLVDAALAYRRMEPDGSGGGFDPGDPSLQQGYRMTELARQGLLEKRSVLQRETTEMLWEKYQNPMLGILGGHLLLMSPTPDLAMLQTVVRNLRSMLGKHPDVDALALALNEDPPPRFETLPMLRKSWQQVLKASIRRPEIVPLDSEASALSNHLWGEGLWLFATVKPPEAAAEATGVVRSLKRKNSPPVELTRYEDAALRQISAARGSPAVAFSQPQAFSLPEALESAKSLPEMDDDTAAQMVEMLGVPRGNVEQFLQRASEKAQLYEAVRSEMQPGFKRTHAMTKIVSEIQSAAASDTAEAARSVRELIKEDSDGSRVAAFGVLQVQPMVEFFPFILDGISRSRSAFEQYHALTCARVLLPQLAADQKEALRSAIKRQRGILPGQYIRPTTDRWVLSDIILRQLG